MLTITKVREVGPVAVERRQYTGPGGYRGRPYWTVGRPGEAVRTFPRLREALAAAKADEGR